MKKADTDPNFPAPPDAPSDPSEDLLGALDSFAKPQMLDHKEKGSASEGRDAVEYAAGAHAPPARAEHNTFPNAPVIVHQTHPGLGPGSRDVDTSPTRRNDPPAVETDPSRPASTLPKVALGLVALFTAGVIVFVAIRSGSHEQTDGATTATATTTGASATATAPTTTTALTATITATATETVTAQPTTTQRPLPTTTSPTAPSTSTSRPTATVVHTSAPTITANPAVPVTSSEDPNLSPTMRRPQ